MDHIDDTITNTLRKVSEYVAHSQITLHDRARKSPPLSSLLSDREGEYLIGKPTNVILAVTRAHDTREYLSSIAKVIARKGKVSDDARDDIIAEIKNTREAIRRAIWSLIETRAVESPDDVSTLIHNFVHDSTSRQYRLVLGPLYSRLARVYAHVMHEGARMQMLNDITKTRANQLLGVTRAAINSRAQLCEQIYTAGGFVPLTIALSRSALFGMFGTAYDLTQTIHDNFAMLATHISQSMENIVLLLVSKIPPSMQDNVIEYNNRTIYDSEYVRKHGLLTDITTGLNATVLQRYITLKVLTPSKAHIPQYSLFARSTDDKNGVIVIEALTGNMFRVVGLRLASTRANQYVMTRDECAFLIDGQTSRAEQYNAHIEDAIFDCKQQQQSHSAISDDVLAIVAEYDATQLNDVDQITSALVERVRSELQDHVRARTMPMITRANDAFSKFIIAIVIHSLANILIERAGEDEHARDHAKLHIRAYYVQALRIALVIARALESHGEVDKIISDDIINATIANLRDSGAFIIEKHNGSLYESEHVSSRA